MQFPRKSLTNLDLYPFVTVACNSDGFVIYKNELTRKLYRNVHVGAKLAAYTNVDTSSSHIETTDFYGEKSTVFVCPLEDEDGLYSVITVFSVGLFGTDLYQSSVSEFKSAVSALLKAEHDDAVLEKRSLLRDVVKKHELAKRCNAFTSSYLENANLFSRDTVNITDFIKRTVCIINNRLELEVKLDTCDLTTCTPYVKITKNTVLVLLNLINFTILNSDKDVRITISNTENTVCIFFEYHSKHVFESIFANNRALYYTFLLLSGVSTAEGNGIRISFINQDGRSLVDTRLPLINSNDPTFKSSDDIDKMIEEYISLSNAYFTD